MARPKRKGTDNEDPEQVRNSILDAALAEFADKGLPGARVDDIARAAGTTKRMIYYYFGSKEDLYRETIVHAFGRTSHMGSSEDFAELPTLEALRITIARSFDMHFNRPNFVKLLLQENFQESAYLRQLPNLAERVRDAVDVWRVLLDRGVAEGVIRPGIDPTRLHHSVSALSQFYISNQHSISFTLNVDTRSPDAIAAHRQHVTDLILAWVLKDAGRP